MIVFLILLSFVMPTLFILFLVKFYNGKLNPRIKPIDADVKLGEYYAECLSYRAKLDKGWVTQRWEISPDLSDQYLANMSGSDKRIRLGHIYKKKKELNSYGVKEGKGSVQYAGEVRYKLSSGQDSFELNFTESDYLRYVHLINKGHLINVSDRFEALTRNGWTKAHLRRDLYYKVENLSQDELKELVELINLKTEFTTKTQGKSTITPVEDAVLQVFMRQYQIEQGTQNYLFEDELESIRLGKGVFEMNPQSVLTQNGVYIGGRWFYPEKGNFLTIGGTRSGKGVNLVIPQLLYNEAYTPGSIAVIDIKGTATAITARHLKQTGHDTIILDPWETQTKMGATHGIKGATFNPFDILSNDPDELIDDCQMLANILIPKRKQASDSHWDDKARQWVSTYIYYLASNEDIQPSQKNLSTLRSLFKKSDKARKSLWYDMVDGSIVRHFVDDVNDIRDTFENADREAMGILSNIHRELDVFKSPGLSRNTNTSSFDIKDLTKGNMRLFVIIDSNRLETHSKWLNLIIICIITTIRRFADERVLMILDEFHSIGYMEVLDKSMGFMPEFNLQLWAIIQDLSQLKSMYPKSWETFVANSAVTSWLGLDGNETPDYLSKLISTKHIKYKKDQTIIDELEGNKSNSPELYELPMQSALQLRESDDLLVRVKGLKPLRLKKLPYYEMELKDRADPNPLLKL